MMLAGMSCIFFLHQFVSPLPLSQQEQVYWRNQTLLLSPPAPCSAQPPSLGSWCKNPAAQTPHHIDQPESAAQAHIAACSPAPCGTRERIRRVKVERAMGKSKTCMHKRNNPRNELTTSHGQADVQSPSGLHHM